MALCNGWDIKVLTVLELSSIQAIASGRQLSDYETELPPLPKSKLDSDSLLQLELERVSRREVLQALDLSRYALHPPSTFQADEPLAWQAALDNAQAQLQHQKNRILNLELLLKYGADCWRAKNDHLATHLSSLNQEMASTQRSIDETNKERKLQQEIAGKELGALHNEYLALLSKNAQLEGVCRQLELQKTSITNTK